MVGHEGDDGCDANERTPDDRLLDPDVEQAVLEAFRDPYRRFTVYFLDGRTAGVGELADAVTGWVAASAGSMAGRPDREQVAVDLHHRHLPTLAAAGLVRHDREADRVSLGPLSDAERRLVEWAYGAEAGVGDALRATPPSPGPDRGASDPEPIGPDGLLAEAARRRRTLVVYAPDPTAGDEVLDQFATRNVGVEHESIPAGGPGGFLVVRDDEGFVGSVGLDALTGPAAPPVAPTDGDLGPPPACRQALALLDDTLFTAFDRRQLLATTREIEDRALRVGTGTLRVGFQRLSAMRPQLRLYERLAAETELEIGIHGRRDWAPPALDGVTYHTGPVTEVGRFWFLAFDGGDDPDMACALVAEERSPGAFTGCWTYDPGLAEGLLAHLALHD